MKLRILAGAVAVLALLGVSVSAQASSESQSQITSATVVQPGPNTVGTNEIKTGGVQRTDYGLESIWGPSIKNLTVGWDKLGYDLRQHIEATDVSKPGVVHEAALDSALQAKVNGPAYLPNWGEIFRNTEGNARAELGMSSSGEGLNISTPTATDKVDFGNEADFAGKPVSLTAVKYEVFTTGENIALGQNMPSIKFEISNPAATQTYTTLVYAPTNSAANVWTAVDAKADTGKHWGFTGNASSYFGTPATQNDRCGLNGARCTLTEALAALSAANGTPKFISAGVGKGKDFPFHGAVRKLTINDTTYTFNAGGVTK